jgi:Phosphotransferase enzyme family
MEALNPAEATQLLSELTGQTFELIGRLPGGESGAHEVRGPDGSRWVAKWDLSAASQSDRRVALALTDRLRIEAGWPVPEQWSVESGDCLFVVQQFLSGHPLQVFNEATLGRLLQLHEGRLGLARPEDSSPWPNHLIETLVRGGDDYCLHSSLRTYDVRTSRLLDRIIEIGREVQAKELPGRDIVHWDLHAGNLLQIEGRLSGIVDNDFVTVGDAAFDLAILAVSAAETECAPGVREQLFELTVGSLDEARRAAYFAHLILRVLDWAIRRQRTDELEFWLVQSDRFLPA